MNMNRYLLTQIIEGLTLGIQALIASDDRRTHLDIDVELNKLRKERRRYKGMLAKLDPLSN